MASISLAEDEEKVYDAHIAKFSGLVSMAAMVKLNLRNTERSQSLQPTLVTDCGILLSLFKKAIEYRDPVVRRSPVAKLYWPQRETFWDS